MKKKILKFIANVAFIMTVCNVNLACFYWINQPEIPKKAKKLRKF